jgi:hypothetical protein
MDDDEREKKKKHKSEDDRIVFATARSRSSAMGLTNKEVRTLSEEESQKLSH